MEKDFFELYERNGSLALEVGHNSVADWNVVVYDRKGKSLIETTEPAVHVQESGRETAFAKAYIELTEYLSESRGGC